MRVLKIVLGVLVCLCFVQCDSTTAEEYKAQAIGYAESGEHQKAAEAYLKAAEKGDAEAQFFIGILYLTGNNYPNNPLTVDKDKAIDWINKSAEQNNKDALFVMGQLYLDGTINKGNVTETIRYWEVAGNAGNAMALYQLGDIYDNGRGVKTDKHKAVEYYAKAYDNGILMAGVCLVSIQMNDTENYNYLQTLKLSQEVHGKINQLGIDQFDVQSIIRHDLTLSIQEMKL